MADEEDGFGRIHPWERTSPIKKTVVSAERVRTLYGRRRANVVVRVPEKNSLESEVVKDEPERSYKGGRVSDVDKEQIYAIVAKNLEKRKQGGYENIQWQAVKEEVYLSLPHLQGFPVVKIQYIYGRQSNNNKSKKKVRRKDVFTAEVCAALYETFQRYVDPDSASGRIKHGSWPIIYKEMRKRFPALNEVDGPTINASLYKEQRRISK
jgi:hypothetical protein